MVRTKERHLMDWSLIIFITIIAFFCYRGYRKGLLGSLCGILSLLAGYLSAIFNGSQLAKIIESEFQLKGIVGFISASLVLFFGAVLIVNMLFKLFDKVRPSKPEASALSAYGGACAGAIVGMVVAIAIVWTFAFVRDIRTSDTQVALSPIEKLTNQTASNVVKTALSIGSARPELSRLSAALIEAPVEITRQAKRLSRSNYLSQLLNNPGNQAVLNTGNAKAVQQLPDFKQLAGNPDMQALARSAGLLDKSVDNSQSMEAALAAQVIDIWGRT